MIWWAIVELGSLSRWFYWDDGCWMSLLMRYRLLRLSVNLNVCSG